MCVPFDATEKKTPVFLRLFKPDGKKVKTVFAFFCAGNACTPTHQKLLFHKNLAIGTECTGRYHVGGLEEPEPYGTEIHPTATARRTPSAQP